ncbi:Hypothetical predicted protein [Olea europaea subsp. europaea]|uniref:Uncharacterized protein n=1 Tax=Olea europaea subsp. europaea TaxID=158383 RepID=A0A8S0S1E0_OLEEU|nr:Hypothetical predicted protein [Olea europaea subsp. europaea]
MVEIYVELVMVDIKGGGVIRGGGYGDGADGGGCRVRGGGNAERGGDLDGRGKDLCRGGDGDGGTQREGNGNLCGNGVDGGHCGSGTATGGEGGGDLGNGGVGEHGSRYLYEELEINKTTAIVLVSVMTMHGFTMIVAFAQARSVH